jgi:hypothetical protein
MQQFAVDTGWEKAGASLSKVSGRKHRRIKCSGPAEIRVYPEGLKASGSVVDLSMKGCCIQLGSPLAVGAFARVEVLFSVKGSTLQLAGVIRHRQDNLRTGIEFTNVSLRKGEEIRSVVLDLDETQQAQGYAQRQARMF